MPLLGPGGLLGGTRPNVQHTHSTTCQEAPLRSLWVHEADGLLVEGILSYFLDSLFNKGNECLRNEYLAEIPCNDHSFLLY